MQEIVLTDLIDVQVLQKIQNGFSKFTGMAALTTDAHGNPVTEGSGFTDFCMNLTRKSEKGFARCAECDRKGALMTLEKGKPAVYDCHAGLLDFAAPIMVEGTFVGSFIGGQVRAKEVDEEALRRTAEELGIDPDAYVEAVARTNLVAFERVERAAEFLSEIAEVLSQMAYSSYIALEQSRQLERSARSHSNFIVDMNASMKQKVLDWIGMAKQLKDADGAMQDTVLSRLMAKGEEFMSTIDDTVDFSKMANGEIELEEREYNIQELMNRAVRNVREDAKKRGNKITVEVEEVPKTLLGDAGRLNQITTKLLSSLIQNMHNGKITVHVSGRRRSYATDIFLRISSAGAGVSQKEYRSVKDFFENGIPFEDSEHGGLAVLPMLLSKLSGTIAVENTEDEGIAYVVCIPQLSVENR